MKTLYYQLGKSVYLKIIYTQIGSDQIVILFIKVSDTYKKKEKVST